MAATVVSNPVALPFLGTPQGHHVEVDLRPPMPPRAPPPPPPPPAMQHGIAELLGRTPWVTITGALSLMACAFLLATSGSPWVSGTYGGVSFTLSAFVYCESAPGVPSSCASAPAYSASEHTLYIVGVGGLNIALGILAFAILALCALRTFLPTTRAAEVLASRRVLLALSALVTAGTFSGLWAASVESARLTATLEANGAGTQVGASVSASGGMYLTLVALLVCVPMTLAAYRIPGDVVVEVDEPAVDENAGLLEAGRRKQQQEAARRAAQQSMAPAPRGYQTVTPGGAEDDYRPLPGGVYQPPPMAPMGVGMGGPPMGHPAGHPMMGGHPGMGMGMGMAPPPQPAPPTMPTFMAGPTAALSAGESVTVPIFKSAPKASANDAARARATLVKRVAAAVGATAGDVSSEEDALNLLSRALAALEREAPTLEDAAFKEAALDYMRTTLDAFGVPVSSSAAWMAAADKQLDKLMGGSR